MSVSTRRRIARNSIWVCVITVVFAAMAFTVAPHRFPFSAVLRADVPAITGIIASRFYLHRSGTR